MMVSPDATPPRPTPSPADYRAAIAASPAVRRQVLQVIAAVLDEVLSGRASGDRLRLARQLVDDIAAVDAEPPKRRPVVVVGAVRL